MASTATQDPLRQIALDHRRIADALEGLLSATYLGEEAREARLRRLRLALEANEALEENAFYPAVADLDAEAAELITQAREAHRGIAAATRALEQSQPAPLTWASCAQRLADLLRAHVEFEERRIFVVARQLTPARLARLGAALQKLRHAFAQRPPGPVRWSASTGPVGRGGPGAVTGSAGQAGPPQEPPRHARPAPRHTRGGSGRADLSQS